MAALSFLSGGEVMVHYSIDGSFHSTRCRYGGDIIKGDNVILKDFMSLSTFFRESFNKLFLYAKDN